MATSVGKRATGEADFIDPEVKDKKLKKGDDSSSTSERTKSELEKFEAELEKFYREKKESHGFDVYANPNAFDMDYIVNFFAFNDLDQVAPQQLKECNGLATEAVKYHNLNKKPENADLEFVKLVKFCHEDVSVRYEKYYLTLDAKDVHDDSIHTCQAKVLCDLANKNTPFGFTPEVLMFKKKYDMDFIGEDPRLPKEYVCDCELCRSCDC
ncbi:hypothetical protein SLEP1_g44536 [Rubroshorea leprosula]|uniref:Uncharacterized protein n=1 Tax=Rubroshorea leprosula TaxID=152421 RepID=A0AAV5LGF7_9ROSI|nr:hypothetical protein SLEP1_g44536 [Rubroshorea leprosula]